MGEVLITPQWSPDAFELMREITLIYKDEEGIQRRGRRSLSFEAKIAAEITAAGLDLTTFTNEKLPNRTALISSIVVRLRGTPASNAAETHDAATAVTDTAERTEIREETQTAVSVTVQAANEHPADPIPSATRTVESEPTNTGPTTAEEFKIFIAREDIDFETKVVKYLPFLGELEYLRKFNELIEMLELIEAITLTQEQTDSIRKDLIKTRARLTKIKKREAQESGTELDHEALAAPFIEILNNHDEPADNIFRAALALGKLYRGVDNERAYRYAQIADQNASSDHKKYRSTDLLIRLEKSLERKRELDVQIQEILRLCDYHESKNEFSEMLDLLQELLNLLESADQTLEIEVRKVITKGFIAKVKILLAKSQGQQVDTSDTEMFLEATIDRETPLSNDFNGKREAAVALTVIYKLQNRLEKALHYAEILQDLSAHDPYLARRAKKSVDKTRSKLDASTIKKLMESEDLTLQEKIQQLEDLLKEMPSGELENRVRALECIRTCHEKTGNFAQAAEKQKQVVEMLMGNHAGNKALEISRRKLYTLLETSTREEREKLLSQLLDSVRVGTLEEALGITDRLLTLRTNASLTTYDTQKRKDRLMLAIALRNGSAQTKETSTNDLEWLVTTFISSGYLDLALLCEKELQSRPDHNRETHYVSLESLELAVAISHREPIPLGGISTGVLLKTTYILEKAGLIEEILFTMRFLPARTQRNSETIDRKRICLEALNERKQEGTIYLETPGAERLIKVRLWNPIKHRNKLYPNDPSPQQTVRYYPREQVKRSQTERLTTQVAAAPSAARSAAPSATPSVAPSAPSVPAKTELKTAATPRTPEIQQKSERELAYEALHGWLHNFQARFLRGKHKIIIEKEEKGAKNKAKQNAHANLDPEDAEELFIQLDAILKTHTRGLEELYIDSLGTTGHDMLRNMVGKKLRDEVSKGKVLPKFIEQTLELLEKVE